MQPVIAQITTPARHAGTAPAVKPGMHSASLISVATLVIWLLCLAVGIAGLIIPYSRPVAATPEPPPFVAEILNVQLTKETFTPPPTVQPPDPLKPPPMHQVVLPADPPVMVAVAEPSPQVAFPLPVEGPVRIVDTAQARPVLREESSVPAVAPAPPVQAITYGKGEGRQPAPDYPSRAVREGQEGAVTIRFSVGENGRVLNAEVVSPSPWPLLNDSALRVVRERWRFREGPPRLYEVAIRFELYK